MQDPPNDEEAASGSIAQSEGGAPPPAKRLRPDEASMTEPVSQSTTINLRELLLTPTSDEEDDPLFGNHGVKLSYTADTTWKEFVGKTLATHSATLKDNMVEKITTMLRTFGQVSGRERTIAQRKKPVKDPDGKDKVFIPAKFRTKPTITQTDEFIDDLQLKALVEEGRKQDEIEMERRALLDLRVRERERDLALKNLRLIIYDMAYKIARAYIIKGKTMTREEELTGKVFKHHLEDKMLADVIACSILLGLKDQDAVYLGAKTGDDLVNELFKLKALDKHCAKIKGALEHATEKDTRELIDNAVQVWEFLFPAITVNILRNEDERYRKMREEAAIKESLEEEEIEDATAEVQEALDTVDETTGLSKPVSSAIRKESKKAARKAVQNDKRRKRKKSSGDVEKETQASRPEKSGQGSNKNRKRKSNATKQKSADTSSKESKSKKNRNSQNEETGKSKKKKKKKGQVQFKDKTQPTPKKSGSASKGPGGQGGSRGGGKTKSAAGR